jgi:hypothetical protein
LSDKDADYYQKKISELDTEKGLLKVAKEQIIVVRSSLKTVNSALADVSANEMQLSESLNIMQKQMNEKERRQSRFFASYSFSCSK